jgi:uncharacterized OB-fold protein
MAKCKRCGYPIQPHYTYCKKCFYELGSPYGTVLNNTNTHKGSPNLVPYKHKVAEAEQFLKEAE